MDSAFATRGKSDKLALAYGRSPEGPNLSREMTVAQSAATTYFNPVGPFGSADVLRAGCDSPPAVFGYKPISPRAPSFGKGQQTRFNSEADGIVRMEENEWFAQRTSLYGESCVWCHFALRHPEVKDGSWVRCNPVMKNR